MNCILNLLCHNFRVDKDAPLALAPEMAASSSGEPSVLAENVKPEIAESGIPMVEAQVLPEIADGTEGGDATGGVERAERNEGAEGSVGAEGAESAPVTVRVGGADRVLQNLTTVAWRAHPDGGVLPPLLHPAQRGEIVLWRWGPYMGFDSVSPFILVCLETIAGLSF